jgi:triosephosphate isomerase
LARRAQRQKHTTAKLVAAQLRSLPGAFEMSKVEPHPRRFIVAYEPTWASSTSGTAGKVAPSEIVSARGEIRQALDHMFGSGFGDATAVIFAGGVDAETAESSFDARVSMAPWWGPTCKQAKASPASWRSTTPAPKHERREH